MKLVERIESVEYHRNGIAGRGFTVVTFWHRPEPRYDWRERRMMAILPDLDEGIWWSRSECYVLDVDLLSVGDVRSGINSWRGDNFADELIPLLKARIEAERAVS